VTRPTLHLTNWSSRKLHGPGRKWTIMARPRRWEHGDGYIPGLLPTVSELDLVRNGRISLDAYRESYRHKVWLMAELTPGLMRANRPPSHERWRVSDGDTLCCACSRAKAAAGECHRVWAAEALVKAGWRVVLDGEEVAT
jgi:hypothetical protein